MTHRIMILWILILPLVLTAESQPSPPPPDKTGAKEETPAKKEDPAHDELRAIRDSMRKAMNSADIEKMLTNLHPDVVFTAMNGDVCLGHDGVRAYFKKMYGPGKAVTKMSFAIKPEALTILYGGDTGVSYGSSVDQFTLKSGRVLDVQSRWSSTLVKEDGRWMIASLHHSTNVFDNAVLSEVKGVLKWALAGGVAGGLVLGLILPALFRRKRKKAA